MRPTLQLKADLCLYDGTDSHYLIIRQDAKKSKGLTQKYPAPASIKNYLLSQARAASATACSTDFSPNIAACKLS